MKPYPVEYRHRIIALLEQAMTPSEIAEVLGVTASWVRSIRQRHEAGESLNIKTTANKRTSLAEREGERIRARLAEKPGSTLEDLRRDLKLETSIPNLWKALKQLKIRFKKSRFRPRSEVGPTSCNNATNGTFWRPVLIPTA